MKITQIPRLLAAQYPIKAHADFAAWQAHISDWVKLAASQKAQLVIFPEYGAMDLLSIFPQDLQADLHANLTALQPLIADFQSVFSGLAQKYQLDIVAPSLPFASGENFVNRAFVFGQNGEMAWQDKFFMTRFEDEDWGISAGAPILSLFETNWGNFGVQICYDVEFAIGAHLLAQAGAQVIAVPSCTETIRGATRVHVGARARALENQCYTMVSQTIGEALWSPVVDINYGYGGCYSPADKGLPETGIVQLSDPQQETWLAADLDIEALHHVRLDGQVLNLRDAKLIAMQHQTKDIQVARYRLS